MKRIFEHFFILFVCLCSFSSAHADEPLKVVIFGDSLVSGTQVQAPQAYATRLDEKLRALGFTGVNVIDLSHENMTTAVALDRLHNVLEQRPDVVVLAFGMDDIDRGVSVAQIYKNMGMITGRIAQSGAYIVAAGITAPPSLGYTYVAQFNALYGQLSKMYKAQVVPDILAGVRGVPQFTLADGVHPNSRGVDIMVENSYRYVDTCLRTRIQGMQYQQDYKVYKENALQPNR